LFNTPLFERIRECLPLPWMEFTEGAARLGIDLERDVDRLAVTSDGMAMSGFFADKPIAQGVAQFWPDAQERRHRGVPMWLSSELGTGIAQAGNLLVAGPRDSMERLLDQALDPPPPGTDAQEIYGDVFMRSDLSALSGGDAAPSEANAVRA